MGKNLKPFHKVRKEMGLPIIPLLFTTVLEALAGTIKEKMEIKGIKTGKEVKLFLRYDDITFHSKDFQNSPENL